MRTASIQKRVFLPSFGILFCLIIIHVMAHVLGVDSKESIASDARSYHFPELQHFLSNPVGFDSSPGLSGPIPGYHWFQSALARVLGGSTLEEALPIIMATHFLISLTTVAALLAGIMSLAGQKIVAFSLVSIVALDYYFLQSSYYFNTETPAYAFLAVLLALLVVGGKSSPGASGGGVGAAGLGLVLTRHSTVPALFGVVAYFASTRQWHALARFSVFGVVIALVVHSYFSFWGGLVSPYWQEQGVASGFFPHSLIHVLALAGAFAPFFYVALREPIAEAISTSGFKIALACAFASVTLLWLLADSNFSPADERRFSIVWRFASLGPEIGAKSLVVLAMMLVSAPLIALMLYEMAKARRLFPELAVIGCYLGAQLLQNLAYQRYVEIPLLMGIAFFSARYAKDDAWTLSALFGLSVIWGGLSISRFLGVW